MRVAPLLWAGVATLVAGCGRGEPQVCNGSAASCPRRYDQVTYAGTHNAYSYAAGGPVSYIYPNQDAPITQQLQAGVRALGIRPSPYFGLDPAEADRVYVTHNVSLRGALGEEPLQDVLTEVRRFLESHPDEVVTLLAESAVTPQQVAETFTAAGLTRYLFTYEPTRGWPTLRDLIVADTRLVVFNDSQDPGRPAWQHFMWQHIVDTDYNITDAKQFSCAPYRGKPENALYFLNQFIYKSLGGDLVVPDKALSVQANDRGLVLQRARGCWQQLGKVPNFIYVDWYGQGDVVGAVNALNAEPR